MVGGRKGRMLLNGNVPKGFSSASHSDTVQGLPPRENAATLQSDLISVVLRATRFRRDDTQTYKLTRP